MIRTLGSLIAITVAFVMFPFFPMQVSAQSVCPVTILKTPHVKGQVQSEGRSPSPIASSKVELFAVGAEEELIDTTLTNEKGLFEFRSIKKGEYRLVAWFTVEGSTYLKYEVILKVKKRRVDKRNTPVISIRLAGDCYGSTAKLVKKFGN